MASDESIVWDAAGTFTITAASLANGAGRQSTMVSNASGRTMIKLELLTMTGTTPTAGTTIDVYWIQGNAAGTYRTDGAGASDAAWTPVNARRIGSFPVLAATSNVAIYLDADLDFPPGEEFGIGLWNASGASLNGTAGNHSFKYQLGRRQFS